MDVAAICMLLALVVMMVIGMPITWSLGGAIIVALMIDPNLSLALITQKMDTKTEIRERIEALI